jgi:TATA-binding protein-associated factor
MPGFLGTEKAFNSKYSRPIQSSRNSKEQVDATLAIQNLHFQVLPFLLHRVKEDVLNDLPNKIIQDYYCELSIIQAKLYENFSKQQVSKTITNQKTSTELNKSQPLTEKKKPLEKSHIFNTLKYLRKFCNHPCFVLNEQYSYIQQLKKKLIVMVFN